MASDGNLSISWAMLGLCGIAYTAMVVRHMRVQTAYQPVFEDWMFHVALPLAAYATLIGSEASSALFIVAAATLLLLFVGIHNAWDAVTYHVLANRREPGDAERPE